jgi:hypothetical protein
MKNKANWIIATLPLFGISLLQFLPRQVSSEIKPPSALKVQAEAVSTENQTKTSLLNIDRRIDESLAKIAQYHTPKIEKFLVDTLMKSRNSKYQSLFDSWQLDKETRELLLKCVYEREYSKKEALKKLGLKGAKVGQTNFWVDLNTENELAGFQFEKILGVERANAFIALEKEMEGQMQSQARQTVNRHIAD